MENHLIYEDDEDLEQNFLRFQETVSELDSLPKSLSIIIWVGGNAHEQTGLRFVLKRLEGKENDIIVKKSNQVDNLKKHMNTACELRHTGELDPRDLKRLYESNTDIILSLAERERLVHDWEVLSNTQHLLRIFKNGSIQSVSENYYDKTIIEKQTYYIIFKK